MPNLSIGATRTQFVTAEELAKFRDTVKIGDEFTLKISKVGYTTSNLESTVDTVRICRKYPYFAQTNKGCIQYIDLYVAKNKGKIKEEILPTSI